MRQSNLFERGEISEDAAVLADRAQARAIKAKLSQFYSDESSFNFSKNGGETAFPDGTPWFACWAWAYYVRRLQGARAWLYGFYADENPWSLVAQRCGGHHFALLDERFVIDGWLVNVEGFSRRAAFDLSNATDASHVRRFYGPPEFWWEKMRIHKAERQIDRETDKERAEALEGVAAAPEIPMLLPLRSRYRGA